MKKIKNESGRSMVEMLGVLAIIGVLSIGGISGYRMAMNKYEASSALNDLNVALMSEMGNLTDGKYPEVGEWSEVEINNRELSWVGSDDGYYRVSFGPIKTSACQSFFELLSDGQIVKEFRNRIAPSGGAGYGNYIGADDDYSNHGIDNYMDKDVLTQSDINSICKWVENESDFSFYLQSGA